MLFLRHADFGSLTARQPAGTGSARILRSMSPNSRRVRCHIGRALEVEGVDRVLEVGMRRWDRAGGPTTQTITVDPEDLPPPNALQIDVAANQIIRVANDPDALELGRMVIEVRGGRR